MSKEKKRKHDWPSLMFPILMVLTAIIIILGNWKN